MIGEITTLQTKTINTLSEIKALPKGTVLKAQFGDSFVVSRQGRGVIQGTNANATHVGEWTIESFLDVRKPNGGFIVANPEVLEPAKIGDTVKVLESDQMGATGKVGILTGNFSCMEFKGRYNDLIIAVKENGSTVNYYARTVLREKQPEPVIEYVAIPGEIVKGDKVRVLPGKDKGARKAGNVYEVHKVTSGKASIYLNAHDGFFPERFERVAPKGTPITPKVEKGTVVEALISLGSDITRGSLYAVESLYTGASAGSPAINVQGSGERRRLYSGEYKVVTYKAGDPAPEADPIPLPIGKVETPAYVATKEGLDALPENSVIVSLDPTEPIPSIKRGGKWFMHHGSMISGAHTATDVTAWVNTYGINGKLRSSPQRKGFLLVHYGAEKVNY